MKYLEESKLDEITAKLTNAKLGISRVINGRIEAYTMKRAGTDKKYAQSLGEQYLAEIETYENQWMKLMDRDNNLKNDVIGEETQVDEEEIARTERRKRSQSAGTQLEATKPAKQQRSRAVSFDVTVPVPAAAAATRTSSAPASSTSASSSYSMIHKSALGDFCETGTRRLMTDLILTLNASFPDYDFANIRPSDFEKIAAPSAMQRINQSLSELVATTKKNESFLSDLWKDLDSVIRLLECDVYSYVPDAACCGEEEDPLGFLLPSLLESGSDHSIVSIGADSTGAGGAVFNDKGTCTDSSNTLLWSFNYFFVNKHLKRIVLFTCIETMQNGQLVQQEDDEEEFSYIKIHEPAGASDVDFDLDPAADVAGGIPISIM